MISNPTTRIYPLRHRLQRVLLLRYTYLMKVLLIDNGTKLLEKLQKLIPEAKITKKWNDVTLLDTKEVDVIILSGSSTQGVVGNVLGLLKEIELVRNAKVPIIGICLGCEIIAYAFGGTLEGMKEKHTGIRTIDIIDPTFYEKPIISVYECHEKIIKEMPKDFLILAKSLQGPEAIKHKTRPIYGLQFHPENFVDETEGDEVFLKLFNQLKG